MTGKPDGYPLPWCDKLDMPYYAVNLLLCNKKEWRECQAYKRMDVIIPWIDKWIEENIDEASLCSTADPE